MSDLETKKRKKGALQRIFMLMLPSPEHKEEVENEMQGGEQEVDQQGRVVLKKKALKRLY